MSGIMMAERLWRERKERIQKVKMAATISPLTWRVALHFIDECEGNLIGISYPHLLGLVKRYGSEKTLEIAAGYATEELWDFINHINHDVDFNRIVVKISDLLVCDDFANYVISLVKENQDMHIE